ncbi:MAG: mobilization protein [Ginsengibacter sp.]
MSTQPDQQAPNASAKTKSKPRLTADQKIAALKEQLAQLEVQKRLAKSRAEEKKAKLTRQQDARKKILIGGRVLELVRTNAWTPAQLAEMMDGGLKRPDDRALFGL